MAKYMRIFRRNHRLRRYAANVPSLLFIAIILFSHAAAGGPPNAPKTTYRGGFNHDGKYWAFDAVEHPNGAVSVSCWPTGYGEFQKRQLQDFAIADSNPGMHWHPRQSRPRPLGLIVPFGIARLDHEITGLHFLAFRTYKPLKSVTFSQIATDFGHRQPSK
jgi:hypothetical protein